MSRAFSGLESSFVMFAVDLCLDALRNTAGYRRLLRRVPFSATG